MENVERIVFLVLATLAVAGAAGVVFFNRPVRAAISLVLNFVVLGGIYFTLGATLLGITQIMVYAGAIMVLFLFVVMMLKQADQGKGFAPLDKAFLPSLGVVAILLYGILLGAIVPLWTLKPKAPPADYGTAKQLGFSLFSQYVWPFEIVSFLLLVGIVGSILLAKRRV